MRAATRPKRSKWWCSPFGKEPLRLKAAVSLTARPLTPQPPLPAGEGEGRSPQVSAQLRLVDYVPAVGHMDPEKTVRRWPDVLRDLPDEGFTVPPGETRVLWLTVDVPAQTEPGQYELTVSITGEDGAKADLPLLLNVHQPLLSQPTERPLRVDFWQSFGSLARTYKVEMWSDEWWGIVRTFLLDLAAHGENVVQVGRGHFDWQKTDRGEWRFGFERFDRYVELCESVGIDGLIEYLQMFDGRAETKLSYADANGKTQTVTANPGDAAFDEVWLAFARALADHCKEKGWLNRLYICPTDEPQDVYGQPTLDRFRHCRKLLRDANAGLRSTAALDSLESARLLQGDIDRFVFKLREDVYDPKLAQELREQGKLVEAYVCCHPDRPNSFITSEAIEQRAIGWILWQEQFQGLLRWSYVNWPPDVWNKPEGDGTYAPGDLFIVYPGDKAPLASTRWERMRDGFEDYEMLRTVQRMIQKSRSPRKDAAQADYDAVVADIAGPKGKLTEYTRDPQRFLAERRRLLKAADDL